MHTKVTTNELTLLRTKAVLERTGLCRSSLYAQIKIGTFPSPVKIGKRAVAWHISDIANWIKSRK